MVSCDLAKEQRDCPAVDEKFGPYSSQRNASIFRQIEISSDVRSQRVKRWGAALLDEYLARSTGPHEHCAHDLDWQVDVCLVNRSNKGRQISALV